MIQKPASKSKTLLAKAALPPAGEAFGEVLHLIQSARQRAYQAVNVELVSLYWEVGQYISQKLQSAEWGDKVVDELARFLSHTQPGLRGFTRPNLFRMRQFYDTYRDQPIVSALLRQLPWTHNLPTLSYAKRTEEREFYIRLAIHEKWSSRELERQLRAARFERMDSERGSGGIRPEPLALPGDGRGIRDPASRQTTAARQAA